MIIEDVRTGEIHEVINVRWSSNPKTADYFEATTQCGKAVLGVKTGRFVAAISADGTVEEWKRHHHRCKGGCHA